MGNYLLWGKAPMEENCDSAPLNPTPTFNKKDTIAAKSGIEIKTTHGTWDSKEKAESLDALIEAPTFNEATLSNEPIHYTTPKNTFSRSSARKNAPPTILQVLEELWQTIDKLELLLNYYDLKSGKRKNPPRDELLNKFTEEEQLTLKEKANHINPYQYLKKRHELVELRKQQFTYKDFYAPVLLPSSYDYRPNEAESISWDYDVEVAPLGLYYKDSELGELVFRLEYNPEDYSESELEKVSHFYWHRSNENGGLVISDLQREILQLKINGEKNQDIAKYINQKYGKSYTTNYISTIFKQKIIKKINDAAQYHFEIIGSLFFPENFRKCNFCGRTLLLHSRNFVKKSKSATGFNSKCKRCEKERRDANKKKRG